MTPEECLQKIMQDADSLDRSEFELLSKKKRDIELEKVTKRWLGWISSVDNSTTTKWDTGCNYDDGEEYKNIEDDE